MAVQMMETGQVPRNRKTSGNNAVVYAEVPPWLKNAVEDEVILAKRSGQAESLTSFTEEALKLLVNQRRQARGQSPLEEPQSD
jgi:hypothetical protein